MRSLKESLKRASFDKWWAERSTKSDNRAEIESEMDRWADEYAELCIKEVGANVDIPYDFDENNKRKVWLEGFNECMSRWVGILKPPTK